MGTYRWAWWAPGVLQKLQKQAHGYVSLRGCVLNFIGSGTVPIRIKLGRAATPRYLSFHTGRLAISLCRAVVD